MSEREPITEGVLGLRRRRRRAARARLLRPETTRALDASGDLLLRARTLAEGVYQGRHRTPDRGASTEFFDYRAYAPGDPVARIDWRLYGRTERYYLRRFHQDAQLALTLLVDASASMDFSGLRPAEDARTKLGLARELAAALAYLAIRQGDRVGLVVAGADRPAVVPCGAGVPALHAVVRTLERTNAARHGTAGSPLPAAGEAMQHASRGRGLAIVLGDALDDFGAMRSALARLRFESGRGGRDVVLLQILTDDELRPEGLGPARLVDAEADLSVRTDVARVADRYAELVDAHVAGLRATLLELGGRYRLVRTREDPVSVLRDVLAAR